MGRPPRSRQVAKGDGAAHADSRTLPGFDGAAALYVRRRWRRRRGTIERHSVKELEVRGSGFDETDTLQLRTPPPLRTFELRTPTSSTPFMKPTVAAAAAVMLLACSGAYRGSNIQRSLGNSTAQDGTTRVT